jgi:hypothetical protein
MSFDELRMSLTSTLALALLRQQQDSAALQQLLYRQAMQTPSQQAHEAQAQAMQTPCQQAHEAQAQQNPFQQQGLGGGFPSTFPCTGVPAR